jgi:hypothetical protein
MQNNHFTSRVCEKWLLITSKENRDCRYLKTECPERKLNLRNRKYVRNVGSFGGNLSFVLASKLCEG